MQGLATLLYGTFVLIYWLLSVFIVYHLQKYLLDRKVAKMISLIFLIVMMIFFFANLSFFLSLPLDEAPSSDWSTR